MLYLQPQLGPSRREQRPDDRRNVVARDDSHYLLAGRPRSEQGSKAVAMSWMWEA